MIDTNQVRAGLDKGVPVDPGHLIDLARDLCDALDVQDEARRVAVGLMEKAEAAVERVTEALAEYVAPVDAVDEDSFNHGVDRAVAEIRKALRGPS